MLTTYQLPRTSHLFEQGGARLVCRRTIAVEDNAYVRPFELNLPNVHSVADDQQRLPVRADFVSRVAGRVSSNRP